MTFRSSLPEQYPTASGRDNYPATPQGTLDWLHALGYTASLYVDKIVLVRKLRPGFLTLDVAPESGAHRHAFSDVIRTR